VKKMRIFRVFWRSYHYVGLRKQAKHRQFLRNFTNFGTPFLTKKRVKFGRKKGTPFFEKNVIFSRQRQNV
jgi:hypothetical protein